MRNHLFAFSAVVILVCLTAANAADLSGKWKGDMKTPNGHAENQRVERDEQGRAHICVQCMKAVKPWGPCYEQGHEVAPIQNQPKFRSAN